jgi:hypothetical protein
MDLAAKGGSGNAWENRVVGRPKGSGKVEQVCEMLASRVYTHRQIAEKTGLSLQRVHDIAYENRDVVRTARANYDEKANALIAQAKRRIVAKAIATDERIVDGVAHGLASGEIEPKLRDYYNVARRHMGNKIVEERTLNLKIDPETMALMERTAAECLRRTPGYMPPADGSGPVIDPTAVPAVEAQFRALPPAPRERAIEGEPQGWDECIGPTSCGGGYRCPAHVHLAGR